MGKVQSQKDKKRYFVRFDLWIGVFPDLTSNMDGFFLNRLLFPFKKMFLLVKINCFNGATKMKTLSQLNTSKSMNGQNLPMNGEYPIVRPSRELRIWIAKKESGPHFNETLTLLLNI